MVTDQKLMDIHVRALFTHDERSRLLFVNEPGAETPAPRLFFGRMREGNLWRFGADLPDTLVEQLEALCAEEPVDDDFQANPLHLDSYMRLLETHAPVSKVSAGPAYYFTKYREPSRSLLAVTAANSDVLHGGLEELIEEVPATQAFLAIVDEGRAVSACRSVRITPEAHEAGVETLPDFRGRGYATDVTAGWAQLVRSMGVLPLYSTSWENIASQNVARKLNLAFFGSDFEIF